MAGLCATGAMVMFMQLLTRSGLANADMVRAIGSLFTKSPKSSTLVGGLIHALVGLLFAFVYGVTLQLAGAQGLLFILLSTGIGFFHGFVMSFILVTAVAEHHPLKRFREAGLSVAISHLGGHVVYGFVIGVVFVLNGFTAPKIDRQVLSEVRDVYEDGSTLTASTDVAKLPLVQARASWGSSS